MARIRTIKPEFFTSEDIVSLTPLARVFYIALWCESDREGRMDWKPGTLKMRYLGGDDCDVNELADELIEAGLIVLYDVEGKRYADIPTFKTHQVINNREAESHRPSRVNDASARVKAEGRKEGEGREGKGKEKEGKEGDTPRKRVEPPDGVSDELWKAFIAVRRAKKAPLSDTAMESIQREAVKAGWPISAVLEECVTRGWTAFKASWVADKTFAQQAADVARSTVPAKQDRDPALVRLENDAKNAAPIPENIREKLAALKVGVLQ